MNAFAGFVSAKRRARRLPLISSALAKFLMADSSLLGAAFVGLILLVY